MVDQFPNNPEGRGMRGLDEPDVPLGIPPRCLQVDAEQVEDRLRQIPRVTQFQRLSVGRQDLAGIAVKSNQQMVKPSLHPSPVVIGHDKYPQLNWNNDHHQGVRPRIVTPQERDLEFIREKRGAMLAMEMGTGKGLDDTRAWVGP